jgi:predicted nucleic acid-binding protein
MVKYYFDTSIWLDFFENRNEPNFPKGKWARKLIDKIIKEDSKIIISDNIIYELKVLGNSQYEINDMFKPFKQIFIFTESTKKQLGKSKDLSFKRKIPKRDALHALIARDNKAILITLDEHFRKISDIIKPKKPKDFI